INAITVTGTAGQTESVQFNSSFTYANLNSITVSNVTTIAFNSNNITTSGTNNVQNYASTGPIAIGTSVLTATSGSIYLQSSTAVTESATGGLVATNVEVFGDNGAVTLEGANTISNIAGHSVNAGFTVVDSA